MIVPATEQPPDWEPALRLYRSLVQTYGQATSLVALGLPDEVGMMPLARIDPDATLALIKLCRSIDRSDMARPEWVLFSTQGYTTTVQVDQIEAVDHGELQELHDLGMPGIEECIVVGMWHHSGEHWTATQAFTRQPYGIIWAEPELLVDTAVYSESDQVLHDMVLAP